MTAVAVTALLIALYTVVSRLSGPEVYGPDDSEIAVAAGGRFTVEVPDDPGGGFHWIVAAPRPDPAVLRPAGERVPDGGGTRWLDFRAVRPGRTDLRLLRCHRCATGAAYEPGARALNFRVTVG
ncbi:hypothetical protein ADL22_13965 [Streptomyces sp. NRRL F-4489]|nr:hypothetical protein ADL22_13965 [Streptomyces sp. NRRL F-4489]